MTPRRELADQGSDPVGKFACHVFGVCCNKCFSTAHMCPGLHRFGFTCSLVVMSTSRRDRKSVV